MNRNNIQNIINLTLKKLKYNCFMNELEILNKSVKDFFTKPMLKIALYPLLITLILMYVTFFVLAGDLLDSLENSAINIESTQIENINGEENITTTQESYTGIHIIDYLLKFSITSGIVGFLLYTIGTLFVMIFSLFIALIIIGFLTPKIIAMIRDRHYESIDFKGFGSIFNTFIFTVKHILIMIVLFFLLVPLYFIPAINIVAFNLPFFYFFHKMLHFDVGSTLLSEEEFILFKHKYKNEMRIKSLLLYFISMIPFMALFSTVFFVIYLAHNYIIKIQVLKLK